MIKELEKLITERLNYTDDEEYKVCLKKVSTGYKLTLQETSYDAVDIKLNIECDKNTSRTELMYLFIKELYREEINWRTKEIHRTKSFLYRKAKQLATWVARNNTNKIENINKEIVERYKETEKLKQEVAYYKQFISVFYGIKTELE